MNNFNFTKNPFNTNVKQTKIAGDHVFKNSDGGRVGLDEIRDRMGQLKNPNYNKLAQNQTNNNLEATRNQIQNMRNIGKK